MNIFTFVSLSVYTFTLSLCILYTIQTECILYICISIAFNTKLVCYLLNSIFDKLIKWWRLFCFYVERKGWRSPSSFHLPIFASVCVGCVRVCVSRVCDRRSIKGAEETRCFLMNHLIDTVNKRWLLGGGKKVWQWLHQSTTNHQISRSIKYEIISLKYKWKQSATDN